MGDRLVDLGDDGAHSLSNVGLPDGSGDPLEPETSTKKALYDRIVEVPRHSVPLVVHRNLLDALVQSCVLDGDPCGDSQVPPPGPRLHG